MLSHEYPRRIFSCFDETEVELCDIRDFTATQM